MMVFFKKETVKEGQIRGMNEMILSWIITHFLRDAPKVRVIYYQFVI
jgi:hypothetical protein